MTRPPPIGWRLAAPTWLRQNLPVPGPDLARDDSGVRGLLGGGTSNSAILVAAMASSVTFNSAAGTNLLALTYSTVTGMGHIYPRLAFVFTARVVLDPRRSGAPPPEVDIRRLRAEVASGAEVIGRGEARELATNISVHHDGHVEIDVPISPAAIQFVDLAARGDDVNLHMSFQSSIRYRQPAIFKTGAIEAEAGPWEDVYHAAMHVDIVVPRSEWVKKVLEPVGTQRYIWLELPVPPLPAGQRWNAVQEHLHQAEARNHEGYDADVLRHCHDAITALSPNDPKAILPVIADQAKRDQLDKALHEFRDFLHSGRHPQKTGADAGKYDTDHRDAAFALALTKVWLTYIARLEAGPRP